MLTPKLSVPHPLSLAGRILELSSLDSLDSLIHYIEVHLADYYLMVITIRFQGM